MYYSRNYIITLLFIAISNVGCSQHVLPTKIKYTEYRIKNSDIADSGLVKMLHPYSENINATMNKVIGFAPITMNKRQPESALGNFMADAMKIIAEEKFNQKIHIAFINHGGIRSFIQKGEITVGSIYELMPFDNLIIVQKVKGDVLKALLDHVADRGGWPVSKGLQMEIANKKAVNIFIDNEPLDLNKYYFIANSDYIANGGDDCDMLRSIPQINKGYLLRDALIEYTERLTKSGKPITSTVENRIKNAQL